MKDKVYINVVKQSLSSLELPIFNVKPLNKIQIHLFLVLIASNLLLGQKSIEKIKKLLHVVEKMIILLCTFRYLSFITE